MSDGKKYMKKEKRRLKHRLFLSFHVVHGSLSFANVFVSATCYLCLFSLVGQGENGDGGRWQDFVGCGRYDERFIVFFDKEIRAISKKKKI